MGQAERHSMSLCATLGLYSKTQKNAQALYIKDLSAFAHSYFSSSVGVCKEAALRLRTLRGTGLSPDEIDRVMFSC